MKKAILAILFLAVAINLPAVVFGQEEDVATADVPDTASHNPAIDTLDGAPLTLIKGELDTLKVYNLNRLSLTDPEIADIVDATESEVLLIGQQIGQTILFIWDDQG